MSRAGQAGAAAVGQGGQPDVFERPYQVGGLPLLWEGNPGRLRGCRVTLQVCLMFN